jgi:hypothetical protein
LAFNSEVAFPNDGGKPVERERQVWSAEAEVSAMLVRIREGVSAEYLRRLGELQGWSP